MTREETEIELNAAPQPVIPELYQLPLARSRYGLPASYDKAQELFAEAEEAYAAARHAEAAKKFIQVAALVKAPEPKTTYSESFAKMRSAAYRDAALAFDLAGQAAEGKRALETAAKADADNAALLHTLAKELAS
ncbi:MAG: hypothetical protein QM723_34610 [Myxococcaceae bacterium]